MHRESKPAPMYRCKKHGLNLYKVCKDCDLVKLPKLYTWSNEVKSDAANNNK